MHTALTASLSLFGFLLFVGGLIGYLKAKSRASLVSGAGFALILGLASALVSSGSVRMGAGLGAIVALALVARFFPAFMKTKKVMPAGMVVAVGAVVLVLSVISLATGT